jgi:DNA-binding transcriptional LysR family regulator
LHKYATMAAPNKRFKGNVSDVDIRLLRLFLTVADCGGFAAAEAQLQTGLSTISKHVKELETRLGVRLCRRGRTGFAMTDEGREVYLAAQQVLAALDLFRYRVNDIHTEIAGELNLGVVDTVLTDPGFRLPAVLAAAKRRAPRVQINVTVDPPNILEKAVLEETLHAVIVTIRQRLPGIEYRFLYREGVSLYCAESHPLYPYCPDNVSIADLAACEFAGRNYAALEEARPLDGIITRTATTNDIEGAALLVLTGCYLGYLPDHYVSATEFPMAMRRVLPASYAYSVEIELATRQNAYHPPAVVNFLNELRREFGHK